MISWITVMIHWNVFILELVIKQIFLSNGNGSFLSNGKSFFSYGRHPLGGGIFEYSWTYMHTLSECAHNLASWLLNNNWINGLEATGSVDGLVVEKIPEYTMCLLYGILSMRSWKFVYQSFYYIWGLLSLPHFSLLLLNPYFVQLVHNSPFVPTELPSNHGLSPISLFLQLIYETCKGCYNSQILPYVFISSCSQIIVFLPFWVPWKLPG